MFGVGREGVMGRSAARYNPLAGPIILGSNTMAAARLLLRLPAEYPPSPPCQQQDESYANVRLHRWQSKVPCRWPRNTPILCSSNFQTAITSLEFVF